jgi:hypothetical protein
MPVVTNEKLAFLKAQQNKLMHLKINPQDKTCYKFTFLLYVTSSPKFVSNSYCLLWHRILCII